jgi:hypothetical protein
MGDPGQNEEIYGTTRRRWGWDKAVSFHGVSIFWTDRYDIESFESHRMMIQFWGSEDREARHLATEHMLFIIVDL